MKALLIIDLQYDFCPGGALAIEEGDKLVPLANELMKQFEIIVASQDWHPANHKSFAANHPWRKPGQVIDLNGLQQVLWPIHCVQGTMGSDLLDELDRNNLTIVFRKGTDPEIDSYSAFFDNGHRKSTGLNGYLKEIGIEELFVMGLATDYCVKFTVLDALELGFKVNLIKDGCRAVNLNEGDEAAAIEAMKVKGAEIISSDSVLT